MARSLAERLRAHEQQKARLAEQEAKLKADERKARTRQLIQAGGLVDKAGLLELEPNALYGALLSLRERTRDAEQIRQWAALGGRTLPARRDSPKKARKQLCSPFPRRWAVTQRPSCAAPASASTSCFSTGKGSPAVTRPRPSQGYIAARCAGSPMPKPLPPDPVRGRLCPPRTVPPSKPPRGYQTHAAYQ